MKYFLIIYLSLFCWLSVFAQKPLPIHGICAHRGAMDTHPENTIEAFKEAIRLHVQMIELDVRLTKDKKLVILHDETVDRTTNGTGKIADLTLAQIKKLDAGSWKAQEFKNMRIPTFREALAVMPDDIWLNVHLKGEEELGRRVAQVILKENRQHQAFLACGEKAANAAQKVSNEIMICNMERQTKTENYVAQTIKNRNEFIQLYKVPVNAEIINYIKPLKADNVKVNYCCTDDLEEINNLFEYGVDFVLVNKPGKVLKAVEASGMLKSP